MEPINGVNAANYTMTVPQNNQDYQNYQNYSSMPMVYEPEVEQKKSSSSNMLGMTALGILAIGGVLYGASKGKKVSGLKHEVAQLSAEKDAALKMKDEAVKLKEEATQALDKERTLNRRQRFMRLFNPNYGLTAEEKEARLAAKKAKAEAKKAAKAEKKGKNTETKPENKPEPKEPENK